LPSWANLESRYSGLPYGQHGDAVYQAGLVGDVPAERLEEGIEELGAELFFLVVRRQEYLAVAGEPFDEVGHEGWRRSTHCGSRYRKIVR
jgi:hypothetical protein